MKCKFCEKEIPDDVTVCPECGAELEKEIAETEDFEIELTAEDTEDEVEEKVVVAPKKKEKKAKKPGLPVWAIICIGVLAAAIVVVAAWLAIDSLKPEESPFTNFTGVDSELVTIRDRVVAKVGDKELTNAELQVYYWMYVSNFVNEYYYSLSAIGLDYKGDLAAQECYMQKGISWQEYFLRECLATWHQYAVLSIAAEKNGVELDDASKEEIAGLRDEMEELAKQNGYASAQEMVEKDFGVGTSVDAYIDAMVDINFVGPGYYNKYHDALEFTEEDIIKYYEDNKELFNTNKVYKDEAYTVSVRHILLQPETTKDASGKDVITDAAWQACKEKAEALLESFLNGEKVTEEVFAELANANSSDGGSNTKGGLYTDFARGKMVAEFENWSFDTSRKYGDTGIVKTTYGYHIMYFVDAEYKYSASVRHILLQPETSKDENGKDVVTDAAWEACKAKAQEVLDAYLAGDLTEEAFAELVKLHTQDTGSVSTGGLYEDFTRGEMVAEFEKWSFDDSRKYGDTGLVKTTYGYHVMFFVETDIMWHAIAKTRIRAEESWNMLEGLMEEYPLNAEYQKMLVSNVGLQ